MERLHLLLQQGQVNRQGRQALGRAVMQFPGDSPPLFVLRVDQTRGKLAQGLFGPLALRNVARHALDRDGLSVAPDEPRTRFQRHSASVLGNDVRFVGGLPVCGHLA